MRRELDGWRSAHRRGADGEIDSDECVRATRPVVPPTPSVEAAKPATGPSNVTSSADPSDDPLDPRWRGSGRRGTNRSTGTDTGPRNGRAARSGER